MIGEIKTRACPENGCVYRKTWAPDHPLALPLRSQAIVSKTAIGGKNLRRSSQTPGVVSKSGSGKKLDRAALLV